jgi:hypothetical protein
MSQWSPDTQICLQRSWMGFILMSVWVLVRPHARMSVAAEGGFNDHGPVG